MENLKDRFIMWLLLWEAKRILRNHTAIDRNVLLAEDKDNNYLLILRNAKYKLRDEGYNED
jgi:hypothetical protein